MDRYLLEAALNAAHNGIIIIDTATRVIYCNDTACELIGISAKEMLQKKIKNVVPNTELDLVVKDGVPRLHRKTSLKDRDIITNRTPIIHEGQIIGAVAVFQDVTELTTAVNQLVNTKDFLNKLETGLEHLSVGVIMVDENAHIIQITESYCNFLGVKQEEVIGRHVREVIANTRMDKVVQSGQAEIGDVMRVNDKDVIVMRMPIRHNNKVVGAIAQVMFQDVSELAKVAAKLNLAEKKLEYYQQEYKRWQKSRYTINHIIGSSPEIRRLKEMINKVAQYPSTVLIRGESGTGKELIAHSIHEAGRRKDGPFVRVNCAAIPRELLESELFGYEEGSFTGASKRGKPGKFEMAAGGTIFLDEIGDMPPEMQVKLLRVLQEKEVDRVGGTEVRFVDTRVIASTNRDLEKMIAKGDYRYDLYYRLNVITLRLPPLREIREDIEEIANRLIHLLNDELGTKAEGITTEVRSLFLNYHWPGNVRELKNTLERAMNVMEGTLIRLQDLPLYLQEQGQTGLCHLEKPSILLDELEQAEEKAIKTALAKANHNRVRAAEILNIHRATLYRKMRKHRIKV